MVKQTILIALLILIASCKDQISPNQEQSSLKNTVTAYTDSSTYYFNGYVSLVKFTIRNSSDSIAFFYHCGGRCAFYLDRKENGQWVEKSSWGIICLAMFSGGIKQILKDSSYTDNAHIDSPGTYRLVFPFSMRFSNSLSDSLVTNDFLVQ
jgi:hypothetical protein